MGLQWHSVQEVQGLLLGSDDTGEIVLDLRMSSVLKIRVWHSYKVTTLPAKTRVNWYSTFMAVTSQNPKFEVFRGTNFHRIDIISSFDR